jgi:hypothetical protein
VIDVRLQNVDRAHFDQLTASVVGHEPFAGGDQRGRVPRNPGHCLDVLRRARLFDE